MQPQNLPQINPEFLTTEQCIRLLKIFFEDFDRRHPELLCTTEDELTDEFQVLYNTIYDENLFKAGMYDIWLEYYGYYCLFERETREAA